MPSPAQTDLSLAMRGLGRAAVVAAVMTGLVLLIVLAASSVGVGDAAFTDSTTCRLHPGEAPYPLDGNNCPGFYDSLVPALGLLLGLGALVFGAASRLFVGPRGSLHPRTGQALTGVFALVGLLPLFLLSIYGLDDAFQFGTFYALRWLYVAIPGIAACVCMIPPAVYYARSGGWGYADYA